MNTTLTVARMPWLWERFSEVDEILGVWGKLFERRANARRSGDPALGLHVTRIDQGLNSDSS